MFQRGTRVNTPRGFAKVVAQCIQNNQTFYKVEMESDSSQSLVPAKEVTLSPEALELVKEYLLELEDLEVGWAGSDEITKNTCPACAGVGSFENRLESASSYTVTHVDCFLCKGNKVVSTEAFAHYARLRQQIT